MSRNLTGGGTQLSTPSPTFSIVVPVYRPGELLRPCLDSILSQTYRDYELILVDDGSPDGSASVCDEYARRDARVTVIHQDNAGVSAARNAGLAQACGTYVLFIDSDDLLFSRDSLNELAQGIAGDDCDLYQFQTYSLKGGEPRAVKTLGRTAVMSVSAYSRLHISRGEVWNFLFVRRFLLEHQLRFLPGVRISEDQAFVYSCFAHCRSIKVLGSVEVYIYRPSTPHCSASLSPALRDQDLLSHLQALQAIIAHTPTAPRANVPFLGERIAMMVMHYVHLCAQLPARQRRGLSRQLRAYAPLRLTYLHNNKAPIIIGAYLHINLGIAIYKLLAKIRR